MILRRREDHPTGGALILKDEEPRSVRPFLADSSIPAPPAPSTADSSIPAPSTADSSIPVRGNTTAGRHVVQDSAEILR
ncbi:MAG TPA: hypothetical protein VK046_04110 [Actinomycetaceae bacterium]|nr:hypothetical protein [Actinomycetaceae bacterium]